MRFTCPSRPRAQIIREAQIILEQAKVQSLLIVLTNSVDYSFGLVAPKGGRVQVLSNIHTPIYSIVNVYSLLKYFLS